MIEGGWQLLVRFDTVEPLDAAMNTEADWGLKVFDVRVPK
jgi:hypothetical protein|tara:strand:- start:997 stop:1116 length:120 start_codon:yes stop_codon:yes gene_type:complete